MPDESEVELDATQDLPEPATPSPGYVPSEGRTINRPAPSPATQFGDFLSRSLGYTR